MRDREEKRREEKRREEKIERLRLRGEEGFSVGEKEGKFITSFDFGINVSVEDPFNKTIFIVLEEADFVLYDAGLHVSVVLALSVLHDLLCRVGHGQVSGSDADICVVPHNPRAFVFL